MKKVLIFSAVLIAFAFTAKAQTAADQTPAAPTGTEVKPQEEVKKAEVDAKATQPSATTVKKECAGHGSGSCAKSGESKSCCKAKTGATPTGSSATAGDKKTATAADKTKTDNCKSGEHKECCKKKAEAKSGS